MAGGGGLSTTCSRDRGEEVWEEQYPSKIYAVPPRYVYIVHEPNASLRDSMGVTDRIQGSDYDIVELDGTARAAYILDHFSL